ncbi:MAG: hypothetical protein IT464_05635 [Planctomycetes bacterium]|nr:hypothetical protein [Planctomycetota bacterium]
MNRNCIIQGAPLARVAPLFALLMLLAAGLNAEGPEVEAIDWLKRSQSALFDGNRESARYAVNALKANPMGARENVQLSLALFWMGQFDDSARYMRRALAVDPGAIVGLPPLASRMPGADVGMRLTQLALRAEADSEMCFLTGALLLIDQDRRRAIAFLVRAEELAGSDTQASRLSGNSDDRSRQRGINSLRTGDWSDATRSFAFAALDTPGPAEHYTGMAIALAASQDVPVARHMLARALARYAPESLFPWLHDLKPAPAACASAGRALLALAQPTKADLQLAALLLFCAGYHASASDAAVRVLVADKLDRFAYDLKSFQEQRGLAADPAGADTGPAAPTPLPDAPQPTPGTLEDARRHIRRADYAAALKVLDPLVTAGAEHEVYRLVFVVLIGKGDFLDAAVALQTWFEKASREDRTRLNAVRDLFGRSEQFDAWHKTVIDRRNADPNAALPRLVNAWIEVTRGRYRAAREELVVAKIELPTNEMVKSLDRILAEEAFLQDVTPDGVREDPSPRALQGQADKLFRAGDFEGARNAYLKAAEADAKLPYITLSLLRCAFALADYNDGYLRLVQLLDEQQAAMADGKAFQLLVVDGYASAQVYAGHLEALRKHCEQGGKDGGIKLDAEAWALYGAVLIGESSFKPAATALANWKAFAPDRQLNSGLLRLLEYANKRSG